jgi:NADH-quinone oxidoreductase subunit G
MSTNAPAQNPAPQPVQTITVKVDGLTVEVPRLSPHPTTGQLIPTTMIQACEAAKVIVPHYCYHPKLPVSGNCRMCLVEFGTPAMGPDRKPLVNPDGSFTINKAPNPAIACATPLAPGMEIYTNTANVKKIREAILEFLLINHPLDCPICDQAGECKLQEYSVEHGQAQSRFVEEKVHKRKQYDLGPRIMLDNERCILCTRCIRFTRDIAGDDALGIINRGGYNTLTRYPDKPFDNNYTLNTVDICPVGALTSKDFRFRMRVWFLKETRSICASCGTGCNILVGSRENRIYRYEPRQNDAVNSCWMCDWGRLNYKWIGRDDRLAKVLKQSVRGRCEETPWPVVQNEIIQILRQAKPGSAAIIASSRQTNEELYLLNRLANKLEAVTDSIPREGEGDKLLVNVDKNPNTVGAQLVGISGKTPGASLARIADGIRDGKIKVLIVFGENPLGQWDKDLLNKLDSYILSDILPNPSSAWAHYVLPGCAPVEKRGTFTNVKGRVQKLNKAVEAPGDARPEWEVLREWVMAVAGLELPKTIEAAFDLMASEVPAFKGMSWKELGDSGMQIVSTP